MERKSIVGISLIYLLIAIFNFVFSYLRLIFTSSKFSTIFNVTFFNIFEYFSILMIFISIYYTFTFNLYKAVLFGLIGTLTSAITIGSAIISFFENTFSAYGFDPSRDIFILIMSIVCLIALFSMNLYLTTIKKVHQKTNTLLIKGTILELGTKFTSLHVKEISQVSKTEKSTIINVIKEMIEKGEIHAEYFSSTNTVAFDQSANIEDIDTLMAQFKKLEENETGKI